MKDMIKIVKEYGYVPIIFALCIGLLYQLNEERKEHLKELDSSRREYVTSMREITRSLDGFNVRLHNIEQKIGG
ncbi:MAG: hypothetical protein ACRC45_00660 [Cetobacterium sp.]